jgi:hypothetical protein
VINGMENDTKNIVLIHLGEIKMTTIDHETVLKAAELFKQWTFTDGGNTRTLLPAEEFVEDMDNRYGLKNTEIDQFVRWEDRTFGLNCGYTDSEVKRWIVGRCGASTKPIKYGETIAIGLGKQPTWLNFADRNVGVNLEFQSKPSCEWRILGGPIGTPVQTNERVALFNEKSMASENVRGEPLIYFNRPIGHFDVGYPTSQGLAANLKDLFKDIGEVVLAVAKVLDLYESISESDEEPKPGEAPRTIPGGVGILGGEVIKPK